MDDDATLLRLAARGDGAAAREFYGRHVGYVWSIVRRFSVDGDEALDASQETFFRVFRTASYNGRASIRTWLFRVASSAAIDLLRTRRRSRHESLDAAAESPIEGVETDPALRESIAGALATLPAAQRDVFILCELMDVSHEAAALQLGIPVGTSRRRLFDAKARLRKLLAGVMREWSS
jgi:RNA polymerase sigma-70 factor (ECF subfamily)